MGRLDTKLQKNQTVTAKKYIDGSGKERYAGTKELQISQYL